MNILMKIIALLMLSSSFLLASKVPVEGTTLQVSAPSGLKLRMEANVNSPSLDVMPYGSYVTLIAFENDNILERIEWNDGNWIKIDYNGSIGWAFDGYLTAFEVPNHKLEKVYEDLDFIYPIEFWVRSQFEASDIEKIEHEGEEYITKYEFNNHSTLTIKDYEKASTLELLLEDARVMEVYQLLVAMIVSTEGKKNFKDATLFIEENGVINHVRVNIENPVQIRKVGNNRVKITVLSRQNGC